MVTVGSSEEKAALKSSITCDNRAQAASLLSECTAFQGHSNLFTQSAIKPENRIILGLDESRDTLYERLVESNVN